jgi:hypothetical protein
MRHLAVAFLTIIVFSVPLLADSFPNSNQELPNALINLCIPSQEILLAHHHNSNSSHSDFAMRHTDSRFVSCTNQPEPMAIPLVSVPALPNVDSILRLPRTAPSQLTYIIALLDIYIAAACLETQLFEMGVTPTTPLPKLVRADYIPSKEKILEI